MSTRDKSGIGYGDQVHEHILSYEKEVLESVFDSRLSDVEVSPVHDRFANVEGMHAVPPPMIGNYIPSGPDIEVDDSMFTYGPKQSKTSKSDTQTSNFNSCESNSSVETLEFVPEPVVVEPKVPSKEQEKPSFAFVNIVKHVKTLRETVKEQNTYSPNPKADKRDWNGLISKRLGLGYGFTKKACFVCDNFSHLIRDSDFHEKRIAKQVEFDREDLETLWKLVKAKHGNTRPDEAYERVLWGNLKVMFEPDIEIDVWRNLQGHKVTVWKLFSSSGVYFVRFQNLHIFMLVEKKYPLTPATITKMLNKKLQADHWNEICYQLLKLMTKHVKNPGSVCMHPLSEDKAFNQERYTNASWISNTEDNLSTSGCVFLLGGGEISSASKKQTCITSSIMEFEFVALTASGMEAEWLRNLILEIPFWSKPIAPISICCDNAATLTNVYSQM
ncbi:hypothetical protein Tco_1348959 [Tanacetum coccineum]